MSNETVGTVTLNKTDVSVPDVDFGGPDDPDFFGGDGPTTCMWDEGFCEELAEYYVLEYCDDPNCKYDHVARYCPRHFIIELGLKVDHLKTCPEMLKATTPEDVRRVAIEHIPGFGPISKNPDRAPSGAPASVDLAPGAAMAQLDEALSRLQDGFYQGAYSDLHMTESTTAEDVQNWLDQLELNHLDFHVERLAADGGAMQLQETRYDADREEPYSVWLYKPGNGEENWFAAAAVSLERRDLMSPKLCTRFNENGELRDYYTCDSMLLGPMRKFGMLTEDDAKAQPGVFAIVEDRTDVVLPITSGSWVRWKALYDGDENDLSVRDDASFHRQMAPYMEYFDTTKDVDPAKMRAKIAELTARANRMIKDGVRPE